MLARRVRLLTSKRQTSNVARSHVTNCRVKVHVCVCVCVYMCVCVCMMAVCICERYMYKGCTEEVGGWW